MRGINPLWQNQSRNLDGRIKISVEHLVGTMDCCCSLTDLPGSLLCNVLRDWLDLKSIGRFDSALCIRKQRAQLHCLYESPELVLCNTQNECNSIVWRWILIKHIKVTHFTDCGSVKSETANEYNEYLKSFGGNIHSATLRFREDIKLAQYCKNIKIFTVGNVRERVNCADVLLNNPGIEELRFERGADQLEGIALPKLTAFSSRLNSVVSESMLQFLKSATCLLKLELTGGSFPTNMLAHCLYSCPHLRSLGLINCDLLDDELASISIYGTSVVNLNLSYNHKITDVGMLQVVTRLKLKSLCLDNCTRLTDFTIQYITTHCAESLEVLYLARFGPLPLKTSEASIEQLHRQCTKMHTFHYRLGATALTDLNWAKPTFVKVSVFTWNKVLECGELAVSFFSKMQILSLGYVGLNIGTLVEAVCAVQKVCPTLRTIVVSDKESKRALEEVLVSQNMQHIAVTDDGTYASYNVLNMPIV